MLKLKRKIKVPLDEECARALYAFICEHLEVNNDNPIVEDIMIYVEDEIDKAWGLEK